MKIKIDLGTIRDYLTIHTPEFERDCVVYYLRPWEISDDLDELALCEITVKVPFSEYGIPTLDEYMDERKLSMEAEEGTFDDLPLSRREDLTAQWEYDYASHYNAQTFYDHEAPGDPIFDAVCAEFMTKIKTAIREETASREDSDGERLRLCRM